MKSRPQIVELVDLSKLGCLVERWNELALRLPDTSYFQTPDWVLAWWDTVAERPLTRVACWYDDDGSLVGLLALARDRQRLHRRFSLAVPVLANAGSGAGEADHCGPLVTRDLWPEVSAWLGSTIGSRPLLLRSTRGDIPIPPGARAVESTPCPRLELGPGEQIGRSSNLRRLLKRSGRRLEQSGVRFDWVPAGAVDASVVDQLIDLHRRRREARNAATSLGERHRSLLLRLGDSARPGCGPAAMVARHGTEVVAVMYGFEWNGCFSAYQSGWDPDYAALSLGTVLVDETIGAAAAAGLRMFDLLRGAEPYKYRFGAKDCFDATYLVPRGLAGRVLDARYRVQAWRTKINASGRVADIE